MLRISAIPSPQSAKICVHLRTNSVLFFLRGLFFLFLQIAHQNRKLNATLLIALILYYRESPQPIRILTSFDLAKLVG
jgi:hypothetical protein